MFFCGIWVFYRNEGPSYKFTDLIKVRSFFFFLKNQCTFQSKGMVLTTSITWIRSVVKREKMTLSRSAREIRRSSKKYKSLFFTLNHLSVRSMHRKYIFLLGDRETRKKMWDVGCSTPLIPVYGMEMTNSARAVLPYLQHIMGRFNNWICTRGTRFCPVLSWHHLLFGIRFLCPF